MLILIDTDGWRLCHHHHLALQARSLPEEVVGSRFDNQLGLPVFELRRGAGAGGEIPSAVRGMRSLCALPNAIAGTILVNKCCEFTHAMRIAYMGGNGGGLTQDGDWSGQVYDGRGGSCQQKRNWQQDKERDTD